MSAFLPESSISCPDSDKGGIKEVFEVLLSFLRIENFFLLDIFGLFQTFLSDEKYLFFWALFSVLYLFDASLKFWNFWSSLILAVVYE